MPELPEIETIKSVIEPQIQGLTIESVLVNRSEVIAHPAAEEFCRLAAGRIISSMSRRGKFLIFHLDSGAHILLHLRMTGCLLVAPAEAEKEKHTHLIFQLSGGAELRFSDMRRFGRFWLIRKDEDDLFSGIEKLGLEPFDEAFTAIYLQKQFGKRRKSIKECLLDQSVIAGIGNIYSDEILFRAGISPVRPAVSLTSEEWECLAAVIPACLSYFIEKNRITPEDYWKTKGRDYRNTPYLQVYGHGGGHCPVCGSILCRTVIGGRSSVYCSACQREKT